MSTVTEILDRLSGIAALKERVADPSGQLSDLRRVLLAQQKGLAELRGQVKVLIQMQSQAKR